jgi:conjugal transfer pilus assembly protein TraU
MRVILFALVIAASVFSNTASAACSASFYNPVTDTAWNFALPIKVLGVALPLPGTTGQPPSIDSMPPICICPSRTPPHPPVPGISATYWEPRYMLEVAQEPGCLVSLGTSIPLSAFGFKAASRSTGGTDDHNNRPFVHFYAYPLFELMGQSFDMACGSFDGVPGAGDFYFSEVDPVWNLDALAIFQSPEALLFSNPVAQAACAVDAVAANVWYPLDYMFWCGGSWSGIYPFSGNMGVSQSDQQVNALAATKFIGQQSRRGLMWNTVGPSAMCTAHPAFFMRKTAYRFNQVVPIAYSGDPVYVGETELKWGYTGGGGMPINLPTKQDSGMLIWQGRQCCMRP